MNNPTRMVEGKTRIIKRFVWLQRLEGKVKFMENAYVFQLCRREPLGPVNICLIWKDVRWASRPLFQLYCRCGNELTSSSSFVSDTEEGVRYCCTDCFYNSLWNLDLGPFALEITEGRREPKEVSV